MKNKIEMRIQMQINENSHKIFEVCQEHDSIPDFLTLLGDHKKLMIQNTELKNKKIDFDVFTIKDVHDDITARQNNMNRLEKFWMHVYKKSKLNE